MRRVQQNLCRQRRRVRLRLIRSYFLSTFTLWNHICYELLQFLSGCRLGLGLGQQHSHCLMMLLLKVNHLWRLLLVQGQQGVQQRQLISRGRRNVETNINESVT